MYPVLRTEQISSQNLSLLKNYSCTLALWDNWNAWITGVCWTVILCALEHLLYCTILLYFIFQMYSQLIFHILSVIFILLDLWLQPNIYTFNYYIYIHWCHVDCLKAFFFLLVLSCVYDMRCCGPIIYSWKYLCASIPNHLNTPSTMVMGPELSKLIWNDENRWN